MAAASQPAHALNSRAMDELKAELERLCVWQSSDPAVQCPHPVVLWTLMWELPNALQEILRPFLISCALIFYFFFPNTSSVPH